MATIKYDTFRAELLADPETRAAYDALEPKYASCAPLSRRAITVRIPARPVGRGGAAAKARSRGNRSPLG